MSRINNIAWAVFLSAVVGIIGYGGFKGYENRGYLNRLLQKSWYSAKLSSPLRTQEQRREYLNKLDSVVWNKDPTSFAPLDPNVPVEGLDWWEKNKSSYQHVLSDVVSLNLSYAKDPNESLEVRLEAMNNLRNPELISYEKDDSQLDDLVYTLCGVLYEPNLDQNIVEMVYDLLCRDWIDIVAHRIGKDMIPEYKTLANRRNKKIYQEIRKDALDPNKSYTRRLLATYYYLEMFMNTGDRRKPLLYFFYDLDKSKFGSKLRIETMTELKRMNPDMPSAFADVEYAQFLSTFIDQK